MGRGTENTNRLAHSTIMVSITINGLDQSNSALLRCFAHPLGYRFVQSLGRQSI